MRGRGAVQCVRNPQRASLLHHFGNAYRQATSNIERRDVVAAASQWVLAKYGSVDPWEALEVDLAEPGNLDVDADAEVWLAGGVWMGAEEARAERLKRMRQVSY